MSEGKPRTLWKMGGGNHYWYDPEGQLTDADYGAVDPVKNPNSPCVPSISSTTSSAIGIVTHLL
jgi:hypothetical protein